MTSLKYVTLLLLSQAIWEATHHFVGASPIVHLALASLFCAYGIMTLLLLRLPIEEILLAYASKPNRINTKALSLVLPHVSHTSLYFEQVSCCALLLIPLRRSTCSTQRFYEDRQRPTFSPLLLMILNSATPLLTAVSEYVLPNVTSASLNPSNTLALAFKIFVYLTYSVLVIAVVDVASP